MKFLKPQTFIIFALAGLSGAVLLHTSQSVQQAEDRLGQLETAKYREIEKIRMLKAEWETLNRPERLERLADEFLDLVPPAPDQMTGAVDLPDPAPVEYGREEEYDPVLQPVSYDAPSAVPVPKQKPVPPPRAPMAPPEAAHKETIKEKPGREKAFGDLMDELGGGQ